MRISSEGHVLTMSLTKALTSIFFYALLGVLRIAAQHLNSYPLHLPNSNNDVPASTGNNLLTSLLVPPATQWNDDGGLKTRERQLEQSRVFLGSTDSHGLTYKDEPNAHQQLTKKQRRQPELQHITTTNSDEAGSQKRSIPAHGDLHDDVLKAGSIAINKGTYGSPGLPINDGFAAPHHTIPSNGANTAIPLAGGLGNLLTGLSNGTLTGQTNSLEQLNLLAMDIARCDPKKEGVCCVAKNYCDMNATCTSDTMPETIFDIVNALPRCTCNWGFEGDGRTQGTGCTNINECETGEAGCEQVCKDFAPGFACSCYDGYELMPNGKQCQDINECLRNNGNCQHICINQLGSYQCKCAPGYELSLDGHSCFMKDACIPDDAGRGPCEHLCTSSFGRFRCSCTPGFKINPTDFRSCIDRNECIEGLGDGSAACAIDGSQVCTNTRGSFECSCASGYKMIGTAEIIGAPSSPARRNEIKESEWQKVLPIETDDDAAKGSNSIFARNNFGAEDFYKQQWAHLEPISDSIGSHVRAQHLTHRKLEPTQRTGLHLSRERLVPRRMQWDTAVGTLISMAKAASGAKPAHNPATKVDPNEQEASQLADLAKQFVNMAGTATTAVQSLSTVTGGTAALRNQHQDLQHKRIVQQNASRFASVGVAADRFVPYDSWSLEMQKLISVQNQMAKQVPQDHPSPRHTAPPVCVDIDECKDFDNQQKQPCDSPELLCINTPGSYECKCPEGLDWDGIATVCTDIDECALGKIAFGQQINQLHAIATARSEQRGQLVPGRPAICDQGCVNIHGAYECSCLPGFKLVPDGSCEDVDECADSSLNVCEHTCTNLVGSYKCTCNSGFELNSLKPGACEDIDECSRGISGCSHMCTNTVGSYICSCPEPLILSQDGENCRSRPTCLEDSTMCKGDFVCSKNQRDSSWECRCPSGFTQRPSHSTAPPECVDVDECVVGYPVPSQNPCPDPLRPCCLNISGGFRCLPMKRRSLMSSRSLYCAAPSAVFGTKMD